MEIDTSTWKEFRVGDLFECETTKPYISDDLTEGAIPYITRTADNNGCDTHIAPIQGYMNKGDCITIGAEGRYAFYQPDDFIAGVKVYTLRNEQMNVASSLMICSILNKQVYKYNYGRARILDKIKEEYILLPATQTGEPDWQYMEDFMGGLHSKPITTSVKSSHIPLETEKWKEYKLEDVFTLKSGFYNKKPEHSVDGNIPFLASTESNNGTTEYYSIEDIKSWNKVGNEDNTLKNKIYDGNCIAVTVNGSVCNAFYQKDDFTCSHDITALYLKNHIMTSNIAMFLCTIIMKDKYRWSYGRKPHDVRKFGKSIIKLPVTPTGEPDWQYMEDYIKSLPYGDKLGVFVERNVPQRKCKKNE